MVKRKIAVAALFCCLAAALAGTAVINGGGYLTSYANEALPFAQLQVDELPGYAADTAAVVPADTKSKVSFNVGGYGRIGFNNSFENVEITSVLNFSTVGNTTFILRAQGDTLLPAGHAGWTNKGYYFRWYGHGQYDFVKNDQVVASAQNGPLPAMAVDTDYVVKFKAVNNADGTAQITVSVNDAVFVDYADESDVLSAGWFAICSEGSVFNVRGNGFEQGAVNLADVASPVTSGNFPATVNADGSVNTTGGSSGAGYVFQTTDSYAIKTKFIPSAAAGNITLTVGSKKTNDKEMNRPDIVDNDWGWTTLGYTVSWSANGQRHLNRGGALLDYVWNLPGFEADREYLLEFGYKHLGDGSNLVYLFIDDVLKMTFIDRAKDGYTPLTPVSSGVPADLLTYSLLITNGCEATIKPLEKTQYEQKTLITKDMGAPAVIPTMKPTLDRNNSVSAFSSGVVAGYTTATANQSVRFTANFTSIGSNIVFMSRAQGALDTPWGGGWTNKGYTVYLYANGQLILSKNGATLCEGWATGGFSFAAGQDYLIEIGTVDVSDSAVRFFVNVNGVCVANYVDTVSPIKNSGTFVIYSTGMAGSLKQYGYAVPQVDAPSSAKVGQSVTLGYTMDGKLPSDEVSYYIDEAVSTARGKITDGKLVPETGGKLSVYACVNGIYGDSVEITVEQALTAEVINLPTAPVIVGGEQFSVDGKLSDDSVAVESKVFSIVNGTGKAAIDPSTGEITAISAGSVYVVVTINGIQSEPRFLSVSPKIEIGNSTALAVGATRSLSYTANCGLPDETITAAYELISGSEYVTFNAETGVVQAKQIGVITVRVLVTGETFQAVSEAISIAIEAPVVVLRNVQDMVVGQKLTLSPEISEGVAIQTKSLEIISGEGIITVDGDTVSAAKEGSVKIKAVVNGYESVTYTIVVTKLTATLIAPQQLFCNEQATLQIMFNSSEYTPAKVVYSVVSGQQCATVSGNLLTTTDEAGEVKIKAEADDGLYVAYATIKVLSKVSISGVTDNQQIFVGTSFDVSFLLKDGIQVNSVKYELVNSDGLATLTEKPLEAGQTEKDKKATITILSAGTVTVRVTINNEYTDEIVFGAVEQADVVPQAPDYWWAFAIVGVVVVIAAVVVTVVLVGKKKKGGKNDAK